MRREVTIEINAICLNCIHSDIDEEREYLTCDKQDNKEIEDDGYCERWEPYMAAIKKGVGAI